MIEYRDGKPSADLLRLQRVHKGMLAQLAEYCDEKGIQWFLAAGSALGAVRHGDVIPWDDDIDVGLKREDYDRLCASLRREPIRGMFLQDWVSQPGYALPFAKLRLDGSFLDEPGSEPGFHCGIAIDLFPYDHLPRTSLAIWVQRQVLGLLNFVIMPSTYDVASKPRSYLLRGARSMAQKVRAMVPLKPLIRARELVSRADFLPKGQWADCCGMFGYSNFSRTLVPLNDVLPTREGRFGELRVFLPGNPDSYLSRLYGDYMRPPQAENIGLMHATLVRFPAD